MKNTVFLNAARLNFDNRLDFSSIEKLTKVTSYEISSDEEILERVQGQNIVVTKEMPVSGDIIRQFPPSVELICEAGTGYNNIDIQAAKEKGIAVCNIPGYSTEAVAQLTITLMLSLASSIALQKTMIKDKNFNNFTKALEVPHFEVLDKTIGIIGSGTIGREVIKIAHSLGMRVIAYSRSRKSWGDPKVEFVDLDDLFKQSDFVSIHCPLTEETRHLVNKSKLDLMKPTAYIINTSRGPIIKETDLIEALQQGKIAGAGLDVQDPEPPSLDNPMFQMDNVILTPHIGWKGLETRQRLLELVATNIDSFLQGNPVNVVNK